MKIRSPKSDDGRGVSPVIGVILMVAITVTLAAVVGAFVMGVGDELMEPSPSVVIEAADASDNLSYTQWTDPGNGQDIMSIEHRGGDDVSYSEMRIILTHKESGFKIVENNFSKTGVLIASAGPSGTHTNDIVWEKGPYTSSEFVVGDTLHLSEAEGEDRDLKTGEYEVTIIHTKSNTILDQVVVNIQ